MFPAHDAAKITRTITSHLSTTTHSQMTEFQATSSTTTHVQVPCGQIKREFSHNNANNETQTSFKCCSPGLKSRCALLSGGVVMNGHVELRRRAAMDASLLLTATKTW